MNTAAHFASFRFAKSLLIAMLFAAIGLFLLSIADEVGFAFFHWEDQNYCTFCFVLLLLFFLMRPFCPMTAALALKLLLDAALRKKAVNIAPWMGACIGIYISLHAGVEARFHHIAESYIEPVEFTIFGLNNKNCVNAATGIGDGHRLGVCESRTYNNGFLLTDTPNEMKIIYDSSDQLMLPQGKRSHEWQETAIQMGLEQVTLAGLEKSKIIDAFYNVIPLGRHFYRVSM